MPLVGGSHPVQDRGGGAGRLSKSAGLPARPADPGQHLAPVERNEPLREVSRIDRKGLRRVVAALYRQVRERHQKRELVRRHEAPVREQALHVQEELDLPLRIGSRHHFPAR